MDFGNSYSHYQIRDLNSNIFKHIVVGIIINKQLPRKLNSDLDSETRAVWNFTLRDSPCDYINVTIWGSATQILDYNDSLQIGDIVEIKEPRVEIRKANDYGTQFRPIVTSPYHLIVSDSSTILALRDEAFNHYKMLLRYPTKPIASYVWLGSIVADIDEQSARKVDILVAIRSVGDVRNVKTRFGSSQVRNISVFDSSNPGMSISFWNENEIARAASWKPRHTVLFMTDMKVSYDAYMKGPKLSTTAQTIITVNPIGKEANNLRRYAITACLAQSAFIDELVQAIPDPSTINNLMNVRRIRSKVDQIANTQMLPRDEQQFTTLIYAGIIMLDLDGFSSMTSIRCAKCKSLVTDLSRNCENSDCPVGVGYALSVPEINFDLRLTIGDENGSIEYCKLYGKNAEDFLECSVEDFLRMNADEKENLKWKYLFEFCEIRCLVSCFKGGPRVNILQCKRITIEQLLRV